MGSFQTRDKKVAVSLESNLVTPNVEVISRLSCGFNSDQRIFSQSLHALQIEKEEEELRVKCIDCTFAKRIFLHGREKSILFL